MKKNQEQKVFFFQQQKKCPFYGSGEKKNYSGMGFSTYPRMAVPLFYRSPHSTQYKHTIREATYICSNMFFISLREILNTGQLTN